MCRQLTQPYMCVFRLSHRTDPLQSTPGVTPIDGQPRQDCRKSRTGLGLCNFLILEQERAKKGEGKREFFVRCRNAWRDVPCAVVYCMACCLAAEACAWPRTICSKKKQLVTHPRTDKVLRRDGNRVSQGVDTLVQKEEIVGALVVRYSGGMYEREAADAVFKPVRAASLSL